VTTDFVAQVKCDLVQFLLIVTHELVAYRLLSVLTPTLTATCTLSKVNASGENVRLLFEENSTHDYLCKLWAALKGFSYMLHCFISYACETWTLPFADTTANTRRKLTVYGTHVAHLSLNLSSQTG
jgi:hypothetical protein